jgi:hypothetical protein
MNKKKIILISALAFSAIVLVSNKLFAEPRISVGYGVWVNNQTDKPLDAFLLKKENVFDDNFKKSVNYKSKKTIKPDKSSETKNEQFVSSEKGGLRIVCWEQDGKTYQTFKGYDSPHVIYIYKNGEFQMTEKSGLGQPKADSRKTGQLINVTEKPKEDLTKKDLTAAEETTLINATRSPYGLLNYWDTEAIRSEIDDNTLKLIKDKKIDPNYKIKHKNAYGFENPDQGKRILNIASERALIKVVDYLIKNGANINAISDGGENPLDSAILGAEVPTKIIYQSSNADDMKKHLLKKATEAINAYEKTLKLIIENKGVSSRNKKNDVGTELLHLIITFNIDIQKAIPSIIQKFKNKNIYCQKVAENIEVANKLRLELSTKKGK